MIEEYQQKHDSKFLLMQAQFSQMRPIAMAPPVGPRLPMYPPGGPGLGQQMFYGQAPPAFMPPQVILFSTSTILLATHFIYGF